MTLDQLPVGRSAIIIKIGGHGSLRKHFLDMGLTPNTIVSLIKTAPMGDPIEIRLRGYELTLRLEYAACIEINAVDSSPNINIYNERIKEIPHPQVGEMGIYHVIKKGAELSDDTPLTFALIGNQNSGKTTLFNQLTGSNQHVGNFPGVTVDRKDGIIKSHHEAYVTDLPGIYSLSPYTDEEIVTRDFLINSHPKGVINIIDATNIERNLYLTMQLIELDIPIVLALNMMDEVQENGGTIKINILEESLGIPVIPISASKNQGIDELIEHAIHVAHYHECPGRLDFCDENASLEQAAIHRCIHAIIHLITDHANNAGIPVRFAATKLIEGDSLILEALKLNYNEKSLLQHIISEMENETKKDRDAALADLRFNFIERICSNTVVKPLESKEHIRSIKIDTVLTGKYTAIPAFILIMSTVFYLTFGVIGSALSDLLTLAINYITNICDNALTIYGLNPIVHSLVIDGIFKGVGSVLSFLPIIVVLFFFLSILEDSGYMARIAFVMDKILRRIGLSGRSFVPLLIGFGCSVPAIMSTRTLSSERDRKMTILLVPFMSCSAKLPIYALFTYVFFNKYKVLVMTALYFTGILIGILVSLILNKTFFYGEPVPFVMELPNYRFPSPRSVYQLIWDKAKDFITKAFTIIFLATIIIWFLQTFDVKLNVVSDSQNSILAMIGGFISPIFTPLGFGDWKVSTALIAGLTAKESVVSTLTVLIGEGSASLASLFTPFTALIFLVFTLLYTPCVAAISSIKREIGSKKSAAVVILMQCVIAWTFAFIVRIIGILFGF
ncbi:Ferrous iron transport protein B [uncultured Clostridium sp.]|uniref:ferrous iron transport protein B n=1 Tax=uncultured Clostridium sp. TaxID=59620 RepID=UPI000822B5D3|nr:ferrous iron transport protein B [uncultured Clostridium sp.]SCI71805.1 Ferrous iron transport protein B [uncultured Clostridium sp.]